MASGFKGNRVRVSKVSIQGHGSVGAAIAFTIQFTDREGIVYAHTNHQVEAGASPRIHEASAELIEAIKEWAEQTHFHKPSNLKQKALRGIAESIQEGPDPADDLEEQG